MKLINRLIGLAITLTAFTLSFAQEAVEPALYEPLGEIEIGEYEALEEEAEGANLLISVAAPSDQAIDVLLVGPDGFRETVEVQEEQLIEDLVPGVYVVAATDDNLQLAAGKIEVVEGRVAPVAINLAPMEEVVYETETIEAYEPFGVYEVGPYEPIEAEDSGNLIIAIEDEALAGEAVISVIGPDDYRQDVEGNTTLEGLESGAYLVAATAEGSSVSEGIVEVRQGEVATVTIGLEPIGEQPEGEEADAAAAAVPATATEEEPQQPEEPLESDEAAEEAEGAATPVTTEQGQQQPQVQAQLIQDNLSLPPAGMALVRVVHASPDAPAVNVVAQQQGQQEQEQQQQTQQEGQDQQEGQQQQEQQQTQQQGQQSIQGETLAADVSTGSGSDYTAVPAGIYHLQVQSAEDDTVIIDLPETVLEPGVVYSFYILGSSADNTLSVVASVDGLVAVEGQQE